MDKAKVTKVRPPAVATAKVIRQLDRGRVPWPPSMHAARRNTPEARALRATYRAPLAAWNALVALSLVALGRERPPFDPPPGVTAGARGLLHAQRKI